MSGILVSLSGGLDSCTLLSVLCDDGNDPTFIKTVGFWYGSKHGDYEEEAAKRVAKHFRTAHRVLDLGNILGYSRSALMRTDKRMVPEGHYEAESMRQTVVPGRNLLFIAALASLAESEDCHAVYVGVHAGDHHIYPDCRPAFVAAAGAAVGHSTGGKVTLHAPFLHNTKEEIVRMGLDRKAPYHLTRTCYVDDPVACGNCGSCVERRESFEKNGVEDPVEYRYKGPLPQRPSM